MSAGKQSADASTDVETVEETRSKRFTCPFCNKEIGMYATHLPTCEEADHSPNWDR